MLRRCAFVVSLLAAWSGTAFSQAPPTTSELIRNLRSASDQARVDAAQALAARGPAAAPAVNALIAALSDADETVRLSALQALAQIGPKAKDAVPVLFDILKGTDKRLSRGAITALGAIGSLDEKGQADLLGFVSGEHLDLSVAACRALLQVLPADAPDRAKTIPVLVQALKSPDENLRNEATATLGLAGSLALPQLSHLVEGFKADPDTARRAAAALSLMGPQAEAAVPALVLALGASRESVVVQAAATLAAIGPAAAPAVPQLKELLSAKRSLTRAAALNALGEIGPAAASAVGDMVLNFSDNDENVRREAVLAIGKMGDAAQPAIPGLIAALSDKSELVRTQAIWALGRTGPKAVPSLIALLGDENLQETAVVVLGQLGPAARSAVPELVHLLSQKDLPESTRHELILALSRFGSFAEEAVPGLLRILGDEQNPWRADAAWAIAHIGAKGAIPQLIRAMPPDESAASELTTVLPLAVLTLNPENELYFKWALKRGVALLGHEDNRVKQAAAAALAITGKKAVEAVSPLAAGMENTDPAVRSSFLGALAAIGPDAEEGLPAVITALADSEHAVRTAACVTVGKIGAAAKVTAPLLEQHLQDRDPALRLAAAWALVQVDPKRADLGALCTEPLRWGLQSADSRLRKESAQALGSIGPAALHAAPDLQKLVQNGDAEEQQAAGEALRKIQQPKPGGAGTINRIRGGRDERPR
ncbi:MAG: HEAT repeat domain-containing protein [Planctomycetes bacterium]|nr:HEAT repeat domain-containing protein [Planctomycetota bacterium]